MPLINKHREQLIANDPSLVHLDLSDQSLTQKELEELHALIKDNTQVGFIAWSNANRQEEYVKKYIDPILTRNNENFQIWPTDYEHAILSGHAYKSSLKGDTVSLEVQGAEDFPTTITLSDWIVHDVFEHAKSGYYAVLYYNLKRQQLALAHRGKKTEVGSLPEIQEVIKDVRTDIKGVIHNKFIAQQIQGFIATRSAIHIANEKNCQLSVTGHSLGGWHAQLSAYYGWAFFESEGSAAKEIHVVVFDSPGVSKMLNALKPTVNMPENNIELSEVLDILFIYQPLIPLIVVMNI